MPRSAPNLRLLVDLVETHEDGASVPATCKRVHRLLSEALAIENLGLYLVEPSGEISGVAGSLGLSPEEFRLGDAELVRDLRDDPRPVRLPVARHPNPAAKTRLAQRGVERIAIAPLLSGARFVGFMVASRSGDPELADLSDELLLGIGRAVGIALEHVRLLSAARMRRDFDRALLEAARLAGSTTELEPVLAKYAEALAHVCGAGSSEIALRDPRTPERFVLRASFRANEDRAQGLGEAELPRDAPLVTRCLETKRIAVARPEDLAAPARSHFVARLPLVVGEAVLGITSLHRDRDFDEEERALLEAVAREVALAIATSIERQAARRAEERAAVEAEVRAMVRTSFDRDAILSSAVEKLGQELGASRVVVGLADTADGASVRITHEFRSSPDLPSALDWTFTSSDRPLLRIIRAAPMETVVCHDVLTDQRFGGLDCQRPADYQALIYVSFQDGSMSRGGLLVGEVGRPRHWTDEEVRLVRAVGEHCAIAVARAEIYEDARRRASELELTISEMADGFLMVNERLEVVRANAAAQHMLWGGPLVGSRVVTGPPRVIAEELDGRPIAREDYPIVLAVRRGEVVRNREMVVRHTETGRRVTVVVTASPLRDGSGKLVGGVAVFQDVTEARASAAHAARTEKLRVVGELAAGVAHDLNNMLAAVLGRAEVISDSTSEPETRANAHVIAQAARDASLVVGRLTRLSRKGYKRSDRHHVDLVQVVRDAVELTRPRWSRSGSKVSLELQDSGAPLVLMGTAPELGEIFTNLILNAVDALEGGGKIRVSLGRDGPDAVVEVQDDGAGMTDEVLRHAFEPFFTTKGERGTGLGLSICSAIVEAHGGRIEAHSTPGEGTTVRVTLPLAPTDDTPAPPSAEERRAGEPRRVLVVDDDARVRAVLSDLLASFGHEVETAGSGEQALAFVLAGRPLDLLVTDVSMPGMSGLALATEVRERHPGIGIVLVSGWAATATPEALARLRATLLLKPFRVEDVRAQIQTAVELARSVTGVP